MTGKGSSGGLRGLLAFVTANRVRVIVVSAVSLLLPLLGVFTASLIALVTLREGLLEGVIVLAVSLSLAGAAYAILFNTVAPVVQFALLAALPAIALAWVLRTTGSQGLTLSAGVLAGAVAITLVHIFASDPGAWWVNTLVPSVGTGGGLETERRAQLVALVVPVLVPAFLLIAAFLSVLLARWCHALMDNPGGFRSEFHTLRVDPRLQLLLLCVLGVGALLYSGGGTALTELAILLAVLCVFQGIAVMHGIAAARSIGRGGLVGAYVLMVLMPTFVLPVLALVGLGDPWFDFRRRFGQAKS